MKRSTYFLRVDVSHLSPSLGGQKYVESDCFSFASFVGVLICCTTVQMCIHDLYLIADSNLIALWLPKMDAEDPV